MDIITGAIMTTARFMRDDGPLDAKSLLRLATWLSPSFPTSPYAYSHGLERLVADGAISDWRSFLDWARICLTQGAGRNDALLLAATWRAAGNAARQSEIAALAAAMQPSAERRRESMDQGAAFLRAALAAWPVELSIAAPIAYPVAVGAVAAAHDCPLEPTLTLYLNGFCSMLTTAGQKLVPLGQTDAQRAMATLNEQIEALIIETAPGDLDVLGGSALRADIASMRHETQTVRLYRS